MSNKSERVKECQKRKKHLAVERMGGKCCICGYNKCLSALEFHHLDKDDKKEEPSYIILRWKLDDCIEELSKCILVCSNCHREIHDEKSGIDLKEIEVHKKPFMEKICEKCKTPFKTKNYEARYCNSECSYMSNRKVDRPSKSQLKKLLDSKLPWVKIGKMFNVSDNAVRKWAKQYELFEYLSKSYSLKDDYRN